MMTHQSGMIPPSDWSAKRLGEIARIRNERYQPMRNESIPYVGLAHLSSGHPWISTVGDSSDTSSQKSRFCRGDILFGKLRPYLRKVSVPHFDGVCSTDILVVMPRSGITREFLLYVLSSSVAINYAVRHSDGTKMPRTSWRSMSNLPVSLPTIVEQNKITEILGTVDELLRTATDKIEVAWRIKNDLTQRLLTKGIGHTKFKKTKIGEIPESWGEVMNLEDYLYVKGRIGWRGLKREEYTDDGPFLISGFNLISGKIDWKSCFHLSQFRYEESPEIMLQPDDIIMTKDGTIGRLGFIDELPGPSTINATMMLVRVQTADFLPKFIYYVFQGPQFQKIIQEKTSGSAVPHIFQRDIKGFLIPRVPLQEQERIVNILETLDKKIQVEHSLENHLTKLKKGLMQALLTGKVRVKV